MECILYFFENGFLDLISSVRLASYEPDTYEPDTFQLENYQDGIYGRLSHSSNEVN